MVVVAFARCDQFRGGDASGGYPTRSRRTSDGGDRDCERLIIELVDVRSGVQHDSATSRPPSSSHRQRRCLASDFVGAEPSLGFEGDDALRIEFGNEVHLMPAGIGA